MKRKHFIFALMAMLSFTFSAFAQQKVFVSTVDEFREALTLEVDAQNVSVQRSVERRSAAAQTDDVNLTSWFTIVVNADFSIENLNQTVGGSQCLTLDLNGFTLEGQLVNNGTLTIIDSSDEKDGAIVNSNGLAIVNNGTLAIKGGNIISGGVTAIENTGTLYVLDGYVEGGTNALYNKENASSTLSEDAVLVGAVQGTGVSDNATHYYAKIGNVMYKSLEAAVEAATEGIEVKLIADVTLTQKLTLPAGVKFNGNGKQIDGEIWAGGDLEFVGYTKVKTFNAGYNKPTITIGKGACLEMYGGRMVIGHGATFNIAGNIGYNAAKTIDKANVNPSLIIAGASFTGAGVTFNVNNAYVKATAYCSSKNSNASGTFNFNINNSIWDQTGSFVFTEPTNGMNPTFNLNMGKSVLNSTSHLVFAVTKGEIVFDNSNVNGEDARRQIENRSRMTIKNGSVVYGAVAESQNAVNPGTIVVDNATYDVTGNLTGAAVGKGTITLQNKAKANVQKITGMNVNVDATSLLTGVQLLGESTVAVDATMIKAEDGDVKVIDLSANASIEDKVTVNGIAAATYGTDGDVTVYKIYAKIGDVPYKTLQEAINAVQTGETVTLVDNITYTNYVYASGKTTAVNIAKGKDFTLDLAGKSIIGTNGTEKAYELVTIEAGAKLTLEDSSSAGTGKISYTGTRTTADGWMNRCHTILNKGTLVVNGGTVENATPVEAQAVASAIDNSASWGADGTLVVNGGTVISTSYYAVRTDVNTHNTTATSAKKAVTQFNGGTVYGFYMMDRGGDLANMPVNNIEFIVAADATVKPCDYNGQALRFRVNTKSTYDLTVSNDATVEGTVVGAVAKVGEKYFAYLQDAVDVVEDGETIALLSDVTENVTLTEKSGLYYTIDGNGKKMTGTITISSLSDTNDNRRITIKNINFVDTENGRDFITSTATNHYPRLTVEGCSFTGTGVETANTVAIRLKSSHSVVIKDCTGKGLHSFLQNTSGWNLTIENVTVTESKSALALGTVQGVTVKGCNLDVNGYGIRLDANTYNNNAVIADNTVKAFIPVVVRKANAESNLTFNGTNTMTATNEDGLWCAIGTSEYEANGQLPTQSTGYVSVNLNDNGLNANGVYGNALAGEGTAENPYIINKVSDLEYFRTSVNSGATKYNAPGVWVALGADIDLNNAEWTTGIGDGHEWSFDGNFDGKGHTIKNLNIKPYDDANGYLCGGLFGYIYGGVTIKDLVIENATVNFAGEVGKEYFNVGVLVGFANNNGGKANISNITVKGDVKVDAPNAYGVGAIIGYGYRDMGTISNCTVEAKEGSYIKGYSFVGGITGYSYVGAVVENCSVSNIAISATKYSAGGIVGIVGAESNITDCTVAENVTVEGQANVGYVVGAISGNGSSFTINECTSAEPKIGGNYGDNKPVVAMIGNKYYTFEGAVNAVQNGETITLINDVKENITLTEKTGLYYTIDGASKKMNGTITVSSLSDTNDNRRITIKNINFVDATSAKVDFITSVETNRYPRITVENCTFTGSGDATDVAIRLKSSHSVVIKECTGKDLHSFLQNTDGWDMTIENVTVTDSKSGLALGTVRGVTVKGCKIAAEGYGIRLDAGYNNNAVIESNKVEAFIPVVVRKATVDSNITIKGENEFTASNTDGLWCAIGTSEYEANGTMPTAATADVVVTLNDTQLNREGIYGNAFSGKGTEDDPYLINSIKEFEAFRASVNSGSTKYNAPGVWVALAADLDLTNITWTEGIGDGHNWSFDGNFDGKCHTIKNLTVSPIADASGYLCGGLFGYIYGTATIKNLVIQNATINCGDQEGHNVGVLVGFAYKCNGGVIDNVTIMGDIKVDAAKVYGVGAIVGYSYTNAPTITNCKVEANDDSYIKGNRFVGGITGYSYSNAVIDNCSVKDIAISATDRGVAGIAGLALNGTNISNCAVENVTVNGQKNVAYIVGELGGEGGNIIVAENNRAPQPWVGGSYATGESFIATIGTKYYTSIAKAIEAASESDVIKLISDLDIDSETYTIAEGKKVTLDMNGKKIAVTDNKTPNYELFYIYGELTVTGNGTIELTAANDRQWNAMSVIFHNRGGVLNIENGTFTHNGGTDMAFVVDNSGNYYGDATTNVKDGELTSTYTAIRNRMEQNTHGASGKAILNVSGGKIDGTTSAIWAQAASVSETAPATGEINITGGEVGLINTARATGAVSMTTISGGTVAAFKGEAGELKVVEPGVITGDIIIMTAASEQIEYAITNEGMYVAAAAKAGDNNYVTLQAAINAVQDGETITLYADCAENVKITQAYNGKSFTIDGNGKTYTGTIEVTGDKKPNANSTETLTFKNINFDLSATTAVKYAIQTVKNTYARNITVDNCTFVGNYDGSTGYSYGIRVRNGYNLTITNTTADKMLCLVNGSEALIGLVVEDVTVTNTSVAFSATYGTGVASFKNVTIDANGSGVWIKNQNASDLTFENCSINAKTPIWFEEAITNTNIVTLNGENVMTVKETSQTGNWLRIDDKADYAATFKVVDNSGALDMTNTSGLVAYANNGERSFGYNSNLQKLVSETVDGDVVTLLTDVAMDTKTFEIQDDNYPVLFNAKGKNLTFDLNGKAITVNAAAADLGGKMLLAVFHADIDGHMTVTDSSADATGSVTLNVNDAKVYSFFASESNENSDKTKRGVVTINGGKFTTVGKLSNAMFFSDTDKAITVNGGNFHLDGDATGTSGYPWMVNTLGNNELMVVVNGGTFSSDINHHHRPFEVYVPEYLAVDNNGDGTWTIVPAEAYVTEKLDDFVYEAGNLEHKVGYATFDKAIAAVNDLGKTVTLVKDLELTKTYAFADKNFTIDGAGYTIRQAAECNNAIALFDITRGKVAINNVVFDGIKKGAVVRTVGTEFAMDNVTAQNCEHTVGQGLFRLLGQNTITNSTFKNNTCTMVMTLNFDGASDTPQVVDNCVFEGNTANGTAVLYYVKGANCTITDSEFIGNTVNCNNNGATIYLGFQENCSVTGNLFKDNKVNDASTSTRVAGAIFFGYEAEISGNAFDNNTASNANGDVLGQVCSSLYYEGTIDLSGNYWGTEAPVYGKDYTIQHQTGEGTFALTNYYTGYSLENGNVVLNGESAFEVTFVDGQFESYTNAFDMEVASITYKRNLSSKKDEKGKYVWQAIYLPFEIPMSMLKDKYEVTYINDVRQSDTDGDGEVDKAFVEQILVVSENATLKANYPYIIRPLTEDALNFVITLENTTLYKAEEIEYDCSSIHMRFIFTGNNTTLNNSVLKTKYALSGGEWKYNLNSMKPFRVYIAMETRNGSAWIPGENFSLGMRIGGEENEDGTTLIYDVENDVQTVDYIYDLQGRRVLEPQKGNLYIINGKKVIF